MTPRINDLALGIWSSRVGTELDLVPADDARYIPGNDKTTCVIRPEGGRAFRLPARWLDFPAPEPARCPTCGQLIPESKETK
jgi:hypothetical protein